MTRRILQQIEISKIAAVDRPCQEGAVAAILKRAPTKEANMTKLSDLSDADLEKRIDRMIEELDKRTRFALHHDDGDDGGNGNYQNASNTSMDASNDDGDQQ